MLTLLMGLFLVLWAIGNQDLAKMQEFTRSFGAEVGLTSPAATSGQGGEGVLDGASTATTVPQDPSAAAQDALEREQAAAEARAVEAEDMAHAREVITTAA